MNNEKDELKECIAREFEEIAKEEEESLEKDTSLVVPEGTKEAVLARLKEQMREYQREQAEKARAEAERWERQAPSLRISSYGMPDAIGNTTLSYEQAKALVGQELPRASRPWATCCNT